MVAVSIPHLPEWADIAIVLVNNPAVGKDNSDEVDNNGDNNGKEMWKRVTKKHKFESGDEIYTRFDLQLKGMARCPNQRCKCVYVLADGDISLSIARYLCWFIVKTKYKQDLILFEWYKYSALRKSDGNVKMYWFCLPYISDGATDVILEAVRKNVVCSQGLQHILDWGHKRWRSIQRASTVSGVLQITRG